MARMSRFEQLKNIKPQESDRIHRVFNAIGNDNEKAIEAIADLRAFCGRAWPELLQEALRRYRKSQRGED